MTKKRRNKSWHIDQLRSKPTEELQQILQQRDEQDAQARLAWDALSAYRQSVHNAVDEYCKLLTPIANLPYFTSPNGTIHRLPNWKIDKADRPPYCSRLPSTMREMENVRTILEEYRPGLVQRFISKYKERARLVRLTLSDFSKAEMACQRIWDSINATQAVFDSYPTLNLALSALPIETMSFDYLRLRTDEQRRLSIIRSVATRELRARRSLEEDAERKRRLQEKRNIDRARLAALDNSTRALTEQFRNLVHWDGRCVYCGKIIERGINAHLDHIIPVSKGGLAVAENLAWACDQCNFLKRDYGLHKFFDLRKLDSADVIGRLRRMGKFV